ncbi:MAG: hypothetical protein ABJ251_01130 [Paracoccaceae bacterium]
MKAQSIDDVVMRLVCFDVSEAANFAENGGWTVIITQMSNEKFAAEIFIPDNTGDYVDKFPMFENTGFLFSVFEDAPGTNGFDNLAEFAEELFVNDTAAMLRTSEGRRVGTLLDLSMEGVSIFQYDSKNQSINYFVDPLKGEERAIVCEPPFLHTS